MSKLDVGTDLQGIILDFDGVLSDNRVYTSSSGDELVSCSKYDSLALSVFRQSFPHIPIVVITSEVNPSVALRCKKLRLECIQVSCKVSAASDWASRNDISLSHCAFLCNDLNDLPLCKSVGLPFGVGDCNPKIIPFLISTTVAFGGNGAVSEFLDILAMSLKTVVPDDLSSLPIVPLQPTSVGPRDWGQELLIGHVTGRFTFKKLFIKSGRSGGLQFHRLKNEIVYILSGELRVRYLLDGQLVSETFLPGDCLQFPPGAVHQEEALTDCTLLECSTPHFNDRVRVEDLLSVDLSTSNSSLPSTSLFEVVTSFDNT